MSYLEVTLKNNTYYTYTMGIETMNIINGIAYFGNDKEVLFEVPMNEIASITSKIDYFNTVK